MVPNSCFSVLHVPWTYDRVSNNSKINMTLPGTGLSDIWEGKWMDMVLEFGFSQEGYENSYDKDLFNLDDYDELKINLTMFITN